MWVELICSIVVVALTASFLQKLLRRREQAQTQFMKTELGVPDTYEWEHDLLDQVEDVYFDALEAAEILYCQQNKIGPNEVLDKTWPSKLESAEKNKVKMKLMERTMAWVYVYRKVEAQLKKSFPLWKQHIISPAYWASLKAAEEQLEVQFAAIKKECSYIDPQSGTNTEVFREACRIIDTYGYPPKRPDQPSPPRANGAKSGMPVERCTDGKTYEMQQGPNDAELVVFVPTGTQSKQCQVTTKARSVVVEIDGRTHFSKEFVEGIEIAPDSTTWTLHKKADFEPGDKVTLEGLSTAEFNGQMGTVLRPNADSQAKGRIRVELDSRKSLSIKPVNMKNASADKKAAVVLSLEKTRRGICWPMPPWDASAPAVH